MDASLRSFQNYESGVYYDTECSSSNLGHAVRNAMMKTVENG